MKKINLLLCAILCTLSSAAQSSNDASDVAVGDMFIIGTVEDNKYNYTQPSES